MSERASDRVGLQVHFTSNELIAPAYILKFLLARLGTCLCTQLLIRYPSMYYVRVNVGIRVHACSTDGCLPVSVCLYVCMHVHADGVV